MDDLPKITQKPMSSSCFFFFLCYTGLLKSLFLGGRWIVPDERAFLLLLKYILPAVSLKKMLLRAWKFIGSRVCYWVMDLCQGCCFLPILKRHSLLYSLFCVTTSELLKPYMHPVLITTHSYYYYRKEFKVKEISLWRFSLKRICRSPVVFRKRSTVVFKKNPPVLGWRKLLRCIVCVSARISRLYYSFFLKPPFSVNPLLQSIIGLLSGSIWIEAQKEIYIFLLIKRGCQFVCSSRVDSAAAGSCREVVPEAPPTTRSRISSSSRPCFLSFPHHIFSSLLQRKKEKPSSHFSSISGRIKCRVWDDKSLSI